MKTRIFIHLAFALAIAFVLYIIYTFSHTTNDLVPSKIYYHGMNKLLVFFISIMLGVAISIGLGLVFRKKK